MKNHSGTIVYAKHIRQSAVSLTQTFCFSVAYTKTTKFKLEIRVFNENDNYVIFVFKSSLKII